MKNFFKILILSLSCILWFSCSPVKYTPIDESLQSSENFESGLAGLGSDLPTLPTPVSDSNPGMESGPNSEVDSDGNPIAELPLDLQTGESDLDSEVRPVIDAIAKADPEFNASDVYYIRFNLLGNVISKLIQKNYTEEPETCTLDAKWKFIMFSKSKTSSLDLGRCSGFQRAKQVATANGGSCTPQVGTNKQFKFGNIINFDRTTELGADCNCFRRYQIALVNGALLSREVRAFADSETCAAEFPEHR